MKKLEKTEERLIRLLIENKMKVSTAESCTGGLVAMRITSVSGASECFDLGAVTYANEQKMKILGVSEEALNRFGAVSEEVALEMSKGAKRISGADFAVGITGIAGPGGGSSEKPVGLVYISICGEDVHKAVKYIFSGTRDEVRFKASEEALKLVLFELEK